MAYGCSRCGSRNGRAAGVREKIEHLHASSRSHAIAYDLREPVPVYSLLGKKTRVLKAHRLKEKTQVSVAYIPFLRHTVDCPFTSAAF